MKRFLKQARRGMGTLPHVGSHPGTEMFIFFVLTFGLAGGWVGAGVGLLIFGVVYMYGAYDRAEFSDRLSK